MNVSRLLTLALLGLGVSGSAAVFPPAHEFFAPLLADESEPRFGFSLGAGVRERGLARVDVGDYLGIYRMALTRDVAAQLNIGAAIFTRFDATTHNIQVIDYYANVPVDFRSGKTSMRVMFYHDSSHLGDDYLKERGIQTTSRSWEALRVVLAYDLLKTLRIYAGSARAMHTTPAWSGRQSVQGGAEIFFRMPEKARWLPYWANDLQAWERTSWNPTWTSQVGLKTAADYSRGRGITYFAQLRTGPRLEGQFFSRKETVWSAGLKFALSQNPLAPSDPPGPAGKK